MSQRPNFQFWQSVAAEVKPSQFFAWFLAVSIPIVAILSLLMAWRTSVVENPTSLELVVRCIIGFVAFYCGVLVLKHKVILPAIENVEAKTSA